MSLSSDRTYRQLVFTLALVAFPIVLAIAAFSSCDVRRRADKAACRAGAGAPCLALGAYYEAKADGIVGFAMSHGATAAQYYQLGCKAGLTAACERLGHIELHGHDSVKDDGIGYAEATDALARACVDHIDGACDEVDQALADVRFAGVAEPHAAQTFLDLCKHDRAEACFRFARFMTTDHGDTRADPALAKTYFARACTLGHPAACEAAK